MPRTRHYVHDEALGVGIDSTGELLTLQTADRDRVTVSIEADVSSDFALDVKFSPDGSFVTGFDTFGTTASVSTVQDLTVYEVRIRNTTAQTAGDTADVRLGAE